MTDLPFNQEIIEWIANHRSEPLTTIFLVFTFLGGEFGYILLVLLVYWLYDKRIALKLGVVIIVSSLINHILKIIIRNPRPFVSDGTYHDKWALPEGDVEITANQYSTPSGHAMGSASFWGYLYYKFKSRNMLILCIFMTFMVGISRPYLGVHYIEDVFLGWILGVLVTYLIIKYEDGFSKKWNSINLTARNLGTIIVTSIIWITAGLLSDWNVEGQEFATYAGLISGLLVGVSLEQNWINFDPKSNSIQKIMLKVIVGLVIALGVYFGLDVSFAQISGDDSFLGFLLRYIRYISFGLSATILTGWVFLKTNLAKSVESET